MTNRPTSRRAFLSRMAGAAAGMTVAYPLYQAGAFTSTGKKLRVAMVGTGIRGIRMWGRNLVENYGDDVEFVGLCDINPGRLAFGKDYIGASCPTFDDFDTMLARTQPDAVLVMTVDSTHDTFIVKALKAGCQVITEKPMTTDETKLASILEAQRQAGRDIIVTFNYRWSPHRARMKELLMSGRIGRLTSVDFNWYLDVYHGAAYFRRWHRRREFGGSLLVHKATHHFDLLNWWVDADPETVHAFGDLEFYGKNGSFRHTHCRPCPFKQKCTFYWDITSDQLLTDLYVRNEHHDGYLRDGCVFREDVDIFDKMGVNIRYENNVQVSYSLTTYSPYEGYRIAFNGTEGRMEAWIHERQPWPMDDFDEVRVTDNFGKTEVIRIPNTEEGHGGGDKRLTDHIFVGGMDDPLSQTAGMRDGATSVLIGFAARKSIDTGRVIKVKDLVSGLPSRRG